MRRFIFTAALAAIAALPVSVFGNDQETAQQIADSLRSSGRLKDYSIGVKFEEGRAYLLGRVANEQQARLAVKMAKDLPYVSAVENHLEIKPTAKQDFAVEQAAHQSGSRRSVQRDEVIFGAEPAMRSRSSMMMPNEDGPPAVPTAAMLDMAEPSSMPAHSPRGARIPAQGSPRGVHPMSYQGNCPPEYAGNGAYGGMQAGYGSPIPVGAPAGSVNQRVAYDKPNMPCYSWPSYAASPNYAGVTYPNQYSASAWPYIGPFYPYPQVPLGWRRVCMEWKDGWWWLDFNDHCRTLRN